MFVVGYHNLITMPIYTVPLHPGLLIVEPTVEVISTIDWPQDESFQPAIILRTAYCEIYHELPAQPYVNGTWSDEDVYNAIAAHLETIHVP